MTYTPAELFRMHLSFEQSENENKGQFTINKISTDLDLTQAFPSMHMKQKGNNPPQRGNNPYKKQQHPVCPNENKMNYGEARAKTSNRNLYNKNQVRQVSFKEGEKKDRTRPIRMTDEYVAKRKILGFKGSGIICFLWKGTRHIAQNCNVYPHTKPTSTPCKCGLLHPEAVCKSRGNPPQQPGRVVRN